MKTIIFAHPWHGSFNKAILDSVTGKYDEMKEKYTVIDLNKDGFNPVMTEEELALYSQGKSIDPLVEKYQEILKKSDGLVFIFPIWWSTIPAILKGFIDKVFLLDFAYNHNKNIGLTGHMKNIESVKVITTAGTPKIFIQLFLGNPIGWTFNMGTLKAVGMKKIKWIHLCVSKKSPDDKRKKFLEKVKKIVSK